MSFASMMHDYRCGPCASILLGHPLRPLRLDTLAENHERLRAFVDETRPLLQGSRITAWELTQVGVPATLITDSMAGHVMQQGRIDAAAFVCALSHNGEPLLREGISLPK